MNSKLKYGGRLVENVVQAQSQKLCEQCERATEAVRKAVPGAVITELGGEIVIECRNSEDAARAQAIFVSQL